MRNFKLINHEYIIDVLENYFKVDFIFDNIWSWWSFKHEDQIHWVHKTFIEIIIH